MDDSDQPTDEFEADGPPRSTRVADPPVIGAGRRLGDRYRLERRLGHGGMAVVWLATDERLQRDVAIKVISDTLAGDREFLARFRREAHVAAGLQHPNLVPVYDFDAGARPYLVMEYVPGGDLSERISAGDLPDGATLAAELLSALRHIHSAGVLHRDIKPHNVLIDDSGRARLTDFGIAQPANAASLTRTGNVIGTGDYIAPEVKKGDPASERSDLYALGMVLCELLPEHADPGLWELTDRLRASDLERRPQSAAEALAMLERISRRPISGLTTQPHAFDPPTAETVREEVPPRSFEPTASSRRSGGRGRLLGGLALAAVVAALIVGLAIGAGGDEDPRPSQNASANQSGNGDGSSGGAAANAQEPETTPEETDPVAPVEEEPTSTEAAASEDAYALEQEGYQAFLDGRYDDAIAASSQAVELLAGTGADEYYYALFNLGTSLRHAGRPEEALPYLQERLEFDDGNLDQVQAEIDLAEAEIAGEKPEKPPKGTPPGLEDDDE